MPELLTMLEVADRLGVPESTSRRWYRRYEEYVPTVGEGRTRRYKPEAVEVLRMVQALSAENVPADEIESALAAQFTRTVEAPSPESASSPQGVAILGEMVSQSVREALAEYVEEERRGRERLEQQLRVQEELAREALSRLPERKARRETLRLRLRRVLGREV